MPKPYKWVVEFTVDPVWVADGFDLTEERARDMIAAALPWAHEHEVKARVTRAPDAKRMRKEQGYRD